MITIDSIIMFLLGVVGGEGILLNPNEILELSYSWEYQKTPTT